MAKLNIPTISDDGVITYHQVDTLNHLYGVDSTETQVLKSAAGYYIGDLYYDAEMQGYFPNSRDSDCYWAKREEAEQALITGKFPIRIF